MPQRHCVALAACSLACQNLSLMKKRLLLIYICAALPFCALTLSATTDVPALPAASADEPAPTTVEVKGRTVRVLHAQGQVLEVYNITGVPVMKVRIDANDKTVQLNLGRGCYLIKVGNVTRKITLPA